MNLFEEEILKSKKKKTIKPMTLIIIAIVILLILCIVAMIGIIYLKSTILKITLDGEEANDLEQVFIIEENDKVYIPIKRMASYLNYQAYNGDPQTRSEDDMTKCYIETEDETISFTLNSNILTKIIDGEEQQIKIKEPIKEINGELCVNAESSKEAFAFNFYYNKQKNSMTIETYGYLYVQYYIMATNYGYVAMQEETFENASAVLDGMIIVKNEDDAYGVLGGNGEIILETKYDNITYIRKDAEFLVESNGKKGIRTYDKKTKIQLEYDSIEIIDDKNDTYYVVGQSNLYGVLDKNGKTVIHPEYEKIGIESISSYSKNGVTDGFLLNDIFIPVKRDGKWRLYDKEKDKLTDSIYDSLGCPNGKNNLTRTYGVLIIPEYNLIVGAKDGKYNLIDKEGKWLLEDFVLDAVYITVSEGKNIYKISINKEEQELDVFLQEKGITKPLQNEKNKG